MSPNSDRAKHTASKYDFVKVKVWLGEGMSHYYVLSRFLISRMLTVTKIPYMKAVKIALEVKKYLIDNNQFDVSQENLEAILFSVMESKGFGADYTKRYKMVNQFHQQRRPLIIVVCGAPCTGKSSLAQQLASRFNMPNVLQTDMFYELLRTSKDKPLHQRPLWERPDLDHAQLISEFQRECHVVRRSIDGDLTIRDGKSIIIEGLHLDPGLYLQAASAGTGMLFALRSMAIRLSPVLSTYVSHHHAEDESVNGQDNAAEHPQLVHSPGSEWIAQQLQKAYHGLTATIATGSQAQLAQPDSLTAAQDVREQQHLSPPEQEHQHALEAVPDSQHASHQCIDRESRLHQLRASHPDSASQTHSTPPEKIVTLPKPCEEAAASSDTQTDISQPQVKATQGQEQAQKKKGSPAPVFVPIVVSMDARDHKLLVEEWYSRQMRNVPVVSINFSNFSDTLDQLHDYLLQCIESAMAQH
ncbi:MAG: 2-phosphoglycerate expressed [Trebouxia sp. A1-2]|nr:MAG: 2-phosphoglycerate expressed [Trebouxia sp. A1-2]KAA6420587.1 MAG: 2-phosphoglycerate expressed [Trebouxia sp. A1-2]